MKHILISVLSLLALHAYAAQNTITPAQLAEQLQKQGVKQVVHQLADDNASANSPSEWEMIINASEWLKLVSVLAPATDAGFAEDIGTALAQAIPRNVNGVMTVLDDNVIPIRTRNVCSMPLYNETIAEKNEYFVKSVQVLYKNNTVQAVKCLSQLVSVVGQAGPFKEVD